MFGFIKNLIFGRSSKEQDGFSQIQREAVIDLLLLGMYADKNAALAENDIIVKETEKLSWDSGISLELYINTSTCHVREALRTEEGFEKFVMNIGTRLATPEARKQALEICSRMIHSFGTVPDSESAKFISRVKNVFAR